MSEFAQALNDLARLCGKSEYQIAQYSGLDPSFVRRLFDGEKRASNLTIIRLTIALVMDPAPGPEPSGPGAVHLERPEGCTNQRRDCRVTRVSEAEPLVALGQAEP